MKKIGIIAAIVVLVAGLGVVGYAGVNKYIESKNPIIQIFKHVDEMNVVEVEAKSSFVYTDKFFETVANQAKSESKAEENSAYIDLLKNIVPTLMKKFNYMVKSKVVMDPKREDFGLNSTLSYRYDEDELLSIKTATDFEQLTLGVPQLLDKSFKTNIADVFENENKEVKYDIKGYVDILTKSKMPSSSMLKYMKTSKEFFDNIRIEKLGKEKIQLGENKEVQTTGYKFEFTYEELIKLLGEYAKVFKEDKESQDYIYGKADELYNHFIGNKHYEIFGISEEDAKKSYDKFMKEFKEDLEKEDFDIMKSLEERKKDMPEEQAQYLDFKNTNITYTVYLDNKKYVRKVISEVNSPMTIAKSEVTYTAIGDEVEVKPIIDTENIYDFNPTNDKEEVIKKFGEKVIDNVSKNIIGSKAVENIIADLIKHIKEDKDFENKEEIINQLTGFVENTQQTLQFYKGIINMQ